MKVGDLVEVKHIHRRDGWKTWAARLAAYGTPVLVARRNGMLTEILDVDGKQKCLRTARLEVVNASR